MSRFIVHSKIRLPLCCSQPTRNSFNWLCFFSSLHFASYCNINLKAKRVRCLEARYFGNDVVAVLPKGYGKIMIFHLLHSQWLAHEVIIVVSSLNALMKDQI